MFNGLSAWFKQRLQDASNFQPGGAGRGVTLGEVGRQLPQARNQVGDFLVDNMVVPVARGGQTTQTLMNQMGGNLYNNQAMRQAGNTGPIDWRQYGIDAAVTGLNAASFGRAGSLIQAATPIRNKIALGGLSGMGYGAGFGGLETARNPNATWQDYGMGIGAGAALGGALGAGMFAAPYAIGAAQRAMGRVNPAMARMGASLRAPLQDERGFVRVPGDSGNNPEIYWHGTPSGDLRGGPNGLHLGTKKAATEALEARIGKRWNGKGWDGTETFEGGTAHRTPESFGDGLKMQDGTMLPPSTKPSVLPYVNDWPVTNHGYPMGDWQANGRMRGLRNRGKAKSGYEYKNIAEDEGSTSLVVPNGSKIRPANQQEAVKAVLRDVEAAKRMRQNAPDKNTWEPGSDYMTQPGKAYYDDFIKDAEAWLETQQQPSARMGGGFREGQEPKYKDSTELVARERFDIPKLKKLSSGGSDRDVFDLGDGHVLKVSKTARGLAQNSAEVDYYAQDAGLIPKTVEAGKNYVISEKVNPPDAATRKIVKELSRFSSTAFDNKSAALQDALRKYGLDDILNYDAMWNDFTSIRNWGTTAKGKPIHVDGGSLNNSILEQYAKKSPKVEGWERELYGGPASTARIDKYLTRKNLDDPEFRAVHTASNAARRQFGDTDAARMYKADPSKQSPFAHLQSERGGGTAALDEPVFGKDKPEASPKPGTIGTANAVKVGADGKAVRVRPDRNADMDLETLRGKISTSEVKAPIKDRVKETINNFRTDFFNRYTPIMDLANEAEKKLGGLRPSQNPYVWVKRYTGAMGIATQRIDTELTPLLRQAKNFDDLRAYLVAERSNELHGRKNLKGELMSQSAHKALKELKAKVGKQEFEKMQDIARQLYDYQKAGLKELLRVGALSKESYYQITASNRKYVPFNRVMDAVEESGFLSKTRDLNSKTNGLKKIQGSDRDIIDPLESIVKNTYLVQQAVSKQEAGIALINLGRQTGKVGGKIKIKMMPVAKTEHRAEVDKGFEHKLVTFAKSLGLESFKTDGKIKKTRGGYKMAHYSPSKQEVVRHFGTSRETLTHEVGHFLDHKFDLGKHFFRKGDTKPLGDELLRMMDKIGQSGGRAASPEERFAHAFEWWLTHRGDARRMTPKFNARMNELIAEHPQLKPLLKDMMPDHKTATGIETMEETLFAPSPFEPTEPHITILNKGKKEYYSTTKEIADAWAQTRDEDLNFWVKIAALPARTLRAGATGVNVDFFAPNIFRDQFSAAVNNKYGGVPIYDAIKGLSHLLKKDAVFDRWAKSGAQQAAFFSQDRTTLQRTVKEVAQGNWATVGKVAKNPLELIRALGEYSEKGSRIGAFMRAEKGAAKMGGKKFGDEWTAKDTELAAMMESREASIDFAQRGAKMKAYSAVDAFLNARIQGSLKFLESARKRPAQTAAIGMAVAGTPAALLYLHNRNYPEYDEIPDYIRLNNFIFMTGNKDMPFIKIPKGEVGALFGNPVEQLLATIYQDDPAGWPAVAASLGQAISPINNLMDAMPTGAKVVMEQATNYDTFRKRNIVSPFKTNAPAELQYDDQTSETAKALGNNPFIKLSPAKIEHGIRGVTAGVGKQALQLSDAVFFGKKPITADMPVVNRFMGEPRDLNKSAGKVYDEIQKAEQDRARDNNRIKNALRSGDTSVLDGLSTQRANSLSRGVREQEAIKSLTPLQKSLFSASAEQLDTLEENHPEWAADIEHVRYVKDSLSTKKTSTSKAKVGSTKKKATKKAKVGRKSTGRRKAQLKGPGVPSVSSMRVSTKSYGGGAPNARVAKVATPSGTSTKKTSIRIATRGKVRMGSTKLA